MKCPFCGHLETQVVETRMSEDGDSVRRRRQCGACEKRYTTYERPDVSFPNIVKKDGRRIEYKREKLLESMGLALRKRPVSTEQVDNAIERIEEKLMSLGQRKSPPPASANLSCANSKSSTKSPTFGSPACIAALKTSTTSKAWWTKFVSSFRVSAMR
jgi:transcriptional regulator NrdR